MNPLDDQLHRLFRAAAPLGAQPARAPFGLETRVMAAWRGAGTATVWDTAVLVRGLLFASLIMFVSLWPALDQKNNFDSDSLQFADSSVQTDYP
jgi:hypothetical protein